MAKPHASHAPNQTLTSTNWSGAVIQAPSGKSFSTVSAEWGVPQVSQVLGHSLTDAAEWVGLDGYNSNDVCQAGVLETVQTVNGKTEVSVHAWGEWYPNAANMISSSAFDVSPGNTIKITVETMGAGSTSATFVFDNLTTGETYQTNLTAPKGTSLEGNTADFVVETPELISGRTVSQPLLTDLGSPVTFQDASASYEGGGYASLANAIPIDLVSGVPGHFGSYVQEAYGSVSSSAVTVTEDQYWTSPSAGLFVA